MNNIDTMVMFLGWLILAVLAYSIKEPQTFLLLAILLQLMIKE